MTRAQYRHINRPKPNNSENPEKVQVVEYSRKQRVELRIDKKTVITCYAFELEQKVKKYGITGQPVFRIIS
jgi:hypothetical protein